ncbi:metallo-beta-lactamase domain protein [Clostridium sp. CAG:1013]|nr:metallo-beta-lactamase domain protein [Clostridium sp. CAG:1013]
MARLCPLFSGSTGNSYYIGSRSAGVLLDAGRSARQLEQALKRCEVDPLAIQGILITHEHSDHISGVRVLAKKYKLPVFASQGTLMAMESSLGEVERWVLEGRLELAGMEITPFATPHDSAQSLGFRITTADHREFALATDLGEVTPCVREHLLGAEFVVVESNHDKEMLRCGPYPYYLKRRILSERGHLSNEDCAAFLPELVRAGTKRILLAHLSRENNTPTLAGETALAALTAAGCRPGTDFRLEVAAPDNPEGKTIIF